MIKHSRIYKYLTAAGLFFASLPAMGQGMHFSQYYNAPMLLNPANTALMSESDYRVGANYRDQWAKIPVPYKTISGYGDFQLLRNQNMTNWLGIGLAFFNDKAGDGDLALTQTQLSVAYHVQMGEYSMLSAGIYGGYVERSVDFSKVTFDLQWDGFKFDRNIPNGEKASVIKTNFIDFGAGINYAMFPNENTYIKIGVAAAHVNAPKESFYNFDNKVGLRPTANIDGMFKLNGGAFTLNPSIYYTTQKGAYELLYGTLVLIYVGGEKQTTTNLVLGAFHRWDEAIVGAFGLQFGGLKVMSSFDFTMSKLSSTTKSNGAMEFGLIYQGMYGSGSGSRESMNCPRF